MIDADQLAWDKMDGRLPAIIQHADDSTVLMLGYMTREALAATLDSGQVTFFSRSKQRLWRKGETSGNVLKLVSIHPDCDGDALLVRARPAGPTCHLGIDSCFDVEPMGVAWLARLEQVVATRAVATPEESYTARLLQHGPDKAAQKVGEEGVEVALAGVSRDEQGVAEESADLLFHLLVLLRARSVPLSVVVGLLRSRHTEKRTVQEHRT